MGRWPAAVRILVPDVIIAGIHGWWAHVSCVHPGRAAEIDAWAGCHATPGNATIARAATTQCRVGPPKAGA